MYLLVLLTKGNNPWYPNSSRFLQKFDNFFIVTVLDMINVKQK